MDVKTNIFIIVIILVLVSGAIISLNYSFKPKAYIPAELEEGKLTDSQKQTINLTVELCKYLVTINTLIFTVLGFFLNYRDIDKKITFVIYLYSLSFILLLFSLFFSFYSLIQLTSELSQNLLQLYPGKSKVLHFIEMACWTSLSSCTLLLLIFPVILLTKKQ